MPKLLAVDDDVQLLSQLKSWLTEEGYDVETIGLGADALQLLTITDYDVILLDWDLPDMSGLDVCRKIRRQGKRVPIIFLTGHDELHYKESGLDAGGDDFLTKPFERRELAARARSVIRRASNVLSNELVIGDMTYECGTRKVSYANQSARLTPREGALLEYLMRHPNTLFLARDLRNKVWPADSHVTDDSVRTCLKTLRHKFEQCGIQDIIKTVQGAGYIIESK